MDGLGQTEFVCWSQAWLFKYCKASSSLCNLQCTLKAPRWQQYHPGHRTLTHRVIFSRLTAALPHHTNHVCRLCCSRALWTEKQRAQLDSASEARCSAVQSIALFRVLPPHTKPDSDKPTRGEPTNKRHNAQRQEGREKPQQERRRVRWRRQKKNQNKFSRQGSGPKRTGQCGSHKSRSTSVSQRGKRTARRIQYHWHEKDEALS